MEYGICNLAIIPMRAEANEKSELVSQVLFGESFEITEYTENWVKIITGFDNYTGWIGRLQFITITRSVFEELKNNTPVLTRQTVTTALKLSDGSLFYLPVGSTLPFFKGNTSRIGDEQYEIASPIGENKDFEKTIFSFFNSPYLWGGRTHFGIDCSGFSQAVFRFQGIRLLRDAGLQAEQGETIASLNNTQTGDLAFFDNAEGRIVHVGILLGGQKIIHASGKVKIDWIDENGIYSEESARHTHKLKIIKRVR